MWCTVATAFVFGAALVASLVFVWGWSIVLGMGAGFAVCLFMAHLAHTMTLDDPEPSMSDGIARFRRPDAPIRD